MTLRRKMLLLMGGTLIVLGVVLSAVASAVFNFEDRETVQYLICATLAVSLSLAAMVFYFWERLVQQRLGQVIDEVGHIGDKADLELRLTDRGEHEMTKLVVAINETLDALQDSQAELRDNQRMMTTLMSNLPGILYRCRNDEHWTMEFVSEKCHELTGYTADELLENRAISFADIVHPSDRDWLAEKCGASLAARQPCSNEYRILTADGRERWVWDQARGVYSSTGDLLFIEGLIIDITARKQAASQCRAAEEKYRTLVEQLPAVSYTAEFGAQGRWHYVSPQVESLLGFRREEWLGDSELWFRQLHPDDRDRVLVEEIRCRDQGETFHTEYRLLARDGRVLWFRDSAVIVSDEATGKKILHGLMLNITERKTLEERFFQSQKMEAVGRLAGGIAHDFNNLLTAILGYSEIMIRRSDIDDSLRRNATEVQNAANRAATLTRQLLAFSRKQTMQPRILNLSNAVADIEKMLRRLIGEDISLHTIHGAGVGCVKIDPTQIEQVIVNLAVNARDAMPEGGKMTIEIANVTLDEKFAEEHTGIQPGDYVMMGISDTGVGMDETVKAHLFEPFFTTKGQGKGTGLGLATCYGIITQSGGHIVVDSQAGQGANIKIYLPRVAAEAEQLPQSQEFLTLPTGTETVLVAEDEPGVRDLAVGMLRDLGYRVLEASNGNDGKRVAQQYSEWKIDLLFTDVVMPRMDGKQLAEWFREARPETKVLFTSGYTPDETVLRGIEENRIEFLEKPFTPAALARKIRAVLDGRN